MDEILEEVTTSALEDVGEFDTILPATDSLGGTGMGALTKMGKVFRDVIYDQKEVGDYSCTTHGACTAISAMTGLRLSLAFRKKCWAKQIANGANPKVGDYISNACKVVSDFFNDDAEIETVLTPKGVKLNEATIVNAIDQGMPLVAGVKYGKLFWKDEQDDGELNNPLNVPGTGGHCITIVKYWYDENGKMWLKYVENYAKTRNKNIITVEWDAKKAFFFPNAFVIEMK